MCRWAVISHFFVRDGVSLCCWAVTSHLLVRDGVSHTGVGDSLDASDHVSYFPALEIVDGLLPGRKDANLRRSGARARG